MTLCFLVLLVAAACSPKLKTERPLIWSEEFNYSGLPDSAKWGYDVGGSGWGNRELQYYTARRAENARVEGGRLIIEARKEPFEGAQYTSARLVTKGKGDWKYARVEVRAKLPRGRGLWPAIWMLPTDWKHGGWPKSGEIDIMEHVGYMPDTVFGSIHTEAYNHVIGTQRTKGVYKSDWYADYHTYAVEWDAEVVRFLIDGEHYYSFVNEGKGPATWPFDERFHLLLNVAVGGNWGGQKGIDEAVFPQRMEVDWVRVYGRKAEDINSAQ